MRMNEFPAAERVFTVEGTARVLAVARVLEGSAGLVASAFWWNRSLVAVAMLAASVTLVISGVDRLISVVHVTRDGLAVRRLGGWRRIGWTEVSAMVATPRLTRFGRVFVVTIHRRSHRSIAPPALLRQDQHDAHRIVDALLRARRNARTT